MGIRTQTVATCDKCKKVIQEGEIWVDYGTAGIALHWDCVMIMSAAEFIEVAHERGDQMFIKQAIEPANEDIAELKHLDWTKDGRNMKNILAAYKINRPRAFGD